MTTAFSRLRANRRHLVVLAAVASLATLSLSVVPAASGAAPGRASCAGSSAQSRVGHFGGIVHPVSTGAACSATAEPPYGGTPPLINHGGPIMAVPSVGSTVVHTAIYWNPAGHSFPAGYKTIINKYLSDIAADSGKTTNVFSTNTQYSGSNGSGTYHVVAGTPISDTTAYPAAGCVVNSGSVYSDGSGYSTCLSDDQLKAEIDAVVTANGLPRDFGHMYSIFTPKGVESCFFPGNPSNQACTINPSPSAAFCAYHGSFGSAATPTVYANMPFPIYQSATGYSCTAEGLGGGIQSPNGNIDADVEVSPLSHEMSEAFTDPELNAWYDSSGNENGDDCAYIYGTLSGTAGTFYNQVVNAHHYLTQEEFSNAAFVPGVSGCLQGTAVASGPAVTLVKPASGPLAGGKTVIVNGTGFTGATAVKFGSTTASFTVNSATKITATSPAHAAGVINVRVTTSAGTSPIVTADRYTYQNAPTVTSVSPSSGSTAGGQSVTIIGTNFTGASAVKFGTTTTSYTVNSATKITATSPAHAAGLVNVRVVTPSGTSPIVAADHYTYS
jgi:hypothetical protein